MSNNVVSDATQELAFQELTFQELAFDVGDAESGERLDRFLTRKTEAAGHTMSRTRLKALIEAQAVRIDGARCGDAGLRVKTGQAVVLELPPPVDAVPSAESIPLSIAYEDDDLLVVDKPAGLVVHPAAGHQSGTLVNALLAHCGASLSGIGGVKRPGIVHRLDKDTSGLLVVAKTDAAHRGLSLLFADHGRSMRLERRYLAFVWGMPERASGEIQAPLGRHATDRQKMAVVPAARGREAVTHWQLIETFAGPSGGPIASLLGCDLETGRTHQIRVHMAHLGHPLLGDPLYARGFLSKANQRGPTSRAALSRLGRQALHAASLAFAHPITGALVSCESAWPADLQNLRDALVSDA